MNHYPDHPVIPGEGPRRLRGEIKLYWWPLIAVGIVLLAWQPVSLVPQGGLDLSWTAGLDLATSHGLGYGRDIVFTYGPLGFLSVSQLWVANLGELAFAYLVVLRIAAAVALFAGARQSFSVPVCFALAVVVSSIDSGLTETGLLLIVAVSAIRTRLAGRPALLLASAIGAASGLELLNKISVGTAVTVMSLFTILSLPGRRLKLIAAAAGAGVITFLVCWVATSQPLGVIPDYLKSALAISSGYAAAMGYDTPTVDWAYTAALLILAAGVWAAVNSTAGGSRRQRIGASAVWTAFWFFAFKEAFVREEPLHVATFFYTILGGWFAFRWRLEQRALALVGLASLVIFALATQGRSLTSAVDPSANVTAAVANLNDITSAHNRAAAVAAGRQEIKTSEGIDAASLSLLRGRTVTVFPTEIALAWAYNLDWRPLPVLQSYVAYTPYLDRLDADFLASPRAPQRILMGRATGIDGRVLGFDEPQTTRAMLCRYRPIHADSAYAILAKGSDRCSSEQLLATDRVAWGEGAPVPAPPTSHSLVLVRISGAGVAGSELLRALVWKPALRFVVLDGGAYRLVEGTAGDGLALRATSGLDYPPPFSLVPQAKTIAVTKIGQRAAGRPITFRFYSQSFATQ
jgi:hypothetical protein